MSSPEYQPSTLGKKPLCDANRLGLDFEAEAQALPWRKPIIDAHTHIGDVEAARRFFAVADAFGVVRTWSQTPFEEVEAIRHEFGDRIEFVAVPDYHRKDDAETFGRKWLKRIEQFASMGSKMLKFWAAPRGLDFAGDHLRLDSPIRLEAMKLAHSLGMKFMTHVGDPDTWFATTYRDAARYGTKRAQYEPLERLLDQYGEVPWLAAHMAGNPEDLDHVQRLLDRHPNLYIDCSATKWMVRELSRHPARFHAFCRDNKGRVMFGTDIVANRGNMSEPDLYASRFWAMRTLIETAYAGPSPIVDPDLPMVDPSVPEKSTARLHGAAMDDETLDWLFGRAAEHFWARSY